MQSSRVGIQLHMKHNRCLFRIELHSSADYSDEDKNIHSPWIALDTWGLMITLCNGRI